MAAKGSFQREVEQKYLLASTERYCKHCNHHKPANICRRVGRSGFICSTCDEAREKALAARR